MVDIESIINTLESFSHNPLFLEYGLFGLFINGILSPILPFPPEVTGSALILAGESKISVAAILAVSWIISCIIGYYIGLTGNNLKRLLKKRKGVQHKDDRGNYSDNSKNEKRAYNLLSKYGWIILLLSPWIPVIGDIITIIAGIKRYDFKKYIISISIGKTIRAIIIVYLNALVIPLIFN